MSEVKTESPEELITDLQRELAATVQLYANKATEVFNLRQENKRLSALVYRGAHMHGRVSEMGHDAFAQDCEKEVMGWVSNAKEQKER